MTHDDNDDEQETRVNAGAKDAAAGGGGGEPEGWDREDDDGGVPRPRLGGRGERVTFVDADHPQYALSRWAELAGWDLPVMGLGSKQLHVQLPGILTSATCDLAVIDTPPLEEHRGIVTAALRAADDVIVTLAPTTAELHRTGAVFDAIDDVAAVGATPGRVVVCLNRVDRRARADRVIRTALTDAGHYVLHHDVPLRQAYAQAFGSTVTPDGIWTALADEILGRRETRNGGMT